MASFIFDPQVEHLLRRGGFGARPDELDTYRQMSFNGSVTRLIEYDRVAEEFDTHMSACTACVHGAPCERGDEIADAERYAWGRVTRDGWDSEEHRKPMPPPRDLW